MAIQWRQLAEALVAALEPALPSGFQARVEAEAGGIAFLRSDVPAAWVVVGVQTLLEQPGDERELLSLVCWSVLSTAQDFVAESTGEPWPGSGKNLPSPGVQVLDAQVRLWYGQRESPTLVVGPIHR